MRIVAIEGGARAFCSGIDLKELAAGQIDITYHNRWETALRKFEVMEQLVRCLIHGYALGGGRQLAMACDIRVCTSAAQIGIPPIFAALIPGLGTWRLPRFVGMRRAKRLILSGENIDGKVSQRLDLLICWSVTTDIGKILKVTLEDIYEFAPKVVDSLNLRLIKPSTSTMKISSVNISSSRRLP